jgi:hypothetical protein
MPFRILPVEEDRFSRHLILLECGLLINPATRKIYNNMYNTNGKFTVEALNARLTKFGPPTQGFTDDSDIAQIKWPSHVPGQPWVFFYEIRPAVVKRIKRFLSRCVLRLKLKILARRGRVMAKTRPYLKRGMPSEAAAALSTHARYMHKRV